MLSQGAPLVIAPEGAWPHQLGQQLSPSLTCITKAPVSQPSHRSCNSIHCMLRGAQSPLRVKVQGRVSSGGANIYKIQKGISSGKHETLTSDLRGNGLCSGLVIEDEGAPQLAVMLSERVWDLYDEPMIQQHQLWLLPAAAKPSVPEACMPELNMSKHFQYLGCF